MVKWFALAITFTVVSLVWIKNGQISGNTQLQGFAWFSLHITDFSFLHNILSDIPSSAYKTSHRKLNKGTSYVLIFSTLTILRKQCLVCTLI